MSPRYSTFRQAIPARGASLTLPRVLRSADVPSGTDLLVLRLLHGSPTSARRPLSISVAPATVAPALRCDPRVLRRVEVPIPAPVKPGRTSALILSMRDGLKALVRVAAQDPQTRVEVVKLQSSGNRPTEVLPHGAVNGDVTPVPAPFRDLPVSGTSHGASPDPVTVNIDNLVEYAVDQRAARIDTRHAPSIRLTRLVGAARHALFCAVRDYGLPDPLSSRAGAR